MDKSDRQHPIEGVGDCISHLLWTLKTLSLAIGRDEFEALRARVECNDSQSLWPRATRARWRAIDPRMAAIVAALFKDMASPAIGEPVCCRMSTSSYKLRPADS
jgi:hypothetical protein